MRAAWLLLLAAPLEAESIRVPPSLSSYVRSIDAAELGVVVDRAIWWLGLFLFPVLVGQAVYARRRAPLLPSAPGPHSGMSTPEPAHTDRPLRVYLVGESTIAGVGAESHEHGLSGELARLLAARLRRPVHWSALGLVGARVQDCLEFQIELELSPRLRETPADLIVVALGVNDTTKLTPRPEWRATLARMMTRLKREATCPIVFTGLPPMDRFPALPWPLRTVVGARARILDDDLKGVVEAFGCVHHRARFEPRREYLAADGFHPSEAGYRVWAEQLAEEAAPLLRSEEDTDRSVGGDADRTVL